ncbi:MAG: tRNA uracil 4-sulfurtransferase ThiI [bacterium]
MLLSALSDSSAGVSSPSALPEARVPLAFGRLRAGLVVHYHEIALKGENRRFFERQLQRNIARASSPLGVERVERLTGRLMCWIAEGAALEPIIAAVRQVFGIAYFAPAIKLPQELTEICAAAVHMLAERSFNTFKVETKRGQKVFPLTSPQVNALVGEHVLQHYPARVNLKHPDLTLRIEIVDNYALMYLDRCEGQGGLPVGAGEKAVCLLSGGIDSPVAAFRMMKRGVHLIFVHFHSAPFTNAASQTLVERLVERLTGFQYRSTLYLIPLAEIQQHIVAKSPPGLRVIFYRREMLRLAERIADTHRAPALVTGENVSQVASQTLSNIRAINEATQLPVIRPLAGDDKQEIIAQARDLGTFDISIEPFEDCCSLFVPAKPETRAKLSKILDCERHMDLEPLRQQALAQAVVRKFRYPNPLTIRN